MNFDFLLHVVIITRSNFWLSIFIWFLHVYGISKRLPLEYDFIFEWL